MKKQMVGIGLAIIVGLVTVSMPVSATDYFIQGTVREENGTPCPNAYVTALNERTSESLEVQANGQGAYSINLANYQQGYQIGDVIDMFGAFSGRTTYHFDLIVVSDTVTLNVDPVIQMAFLPGTKSTRVCDINCWHRDRSANTFIWNVQSGGSINWQGQGVSLAQVEMSSFVKDWGDDVPNGDTFHVIWTFTMKINRQNDPDLPAFYKMESDTDIYDLSYNERYNYDPYTRIELKPGWNGQVLDITIYVDCVYTNDNQQATTWATPYSESITYTWTW